MRQYKELNDKTLWGVIFCPLFLFAAALLVPIAPAHAADDNTVSIAVDQNAVLKPAGNLYEATTNVIVNTGKPYGFNLTMQADTADLVNANNSKASIKSLIVRRTDNGKSYPIPYLNEIPSNSWGYLQHRYERCTEGKIIDMGPSASAYIEPVCQVSSIYYGVPTISEPAAVIADEGPDKTSVGRGKGKEYKKEVVFAANIKPSTLPQGTYSTNIVYTATAKPKPAPTVDPTICKSGDPKNDCQVDLDANMIPVKYTGTTTNAQWTSLANPEDSSNQGDWYNYNNKQWANAITVKPEALSKYKNQTRVVDQPDILGYWVYIPRYAYEVMRRDGTDKPVSVQNFLIQFEKTTTPRRVPAACPEQGKDYRTQCDLNRDYVKGQPSNQGTWATHPAFTFGKKELNGIWFAKFETTGTTSQPTVLPNEAHISGYYSGMNNQVGNFYSLSKTLGVNDPQNVGGGGFTTTQNNHYLTKFSSRMVNNNDWGAATYLSASKYGAGYNKVQINSSAAKHTTYGDTYSVTGCGPWENGNTDSYGNSNDLWITHKGISVGSLGTQQACSTDNPQRAYNGTIGQLASTTNNPTGIYDMSGGGNEYVAASYSDNLNNSNTNEYFGSAAHPPYVNIYNFNNPNGCTFDTCGGQALYETNDGTNNRTRAQWNNNHMFFVKSSYPWFVRGGNCGDGSYAGLFFVHYNRGGTGDAVFRVALMPTTQN